MKKVYILKLVLECGSFKEAAVRLNVTPSAITQTMAALETRKGAPFLVRGRSKIVATPSGLEILNRYEPVFHLLSQAHETPPRTPLKQLKFGTYESIAHYLIPTLIRHHQLENRSLRIKLLVSRSQQLLALLNKGELGCILITEMEGLAKYTTRTLSVDRLGLYVHSNFLTAQEPSEVLKRIGFGCISPPRAGFPRYFQRFLQAYQLKKPLLECDSFELLRTGASSGAFAAVLPERVAKQDSQLVNIAPRLSPIRNQHETGEHKLLLVAKSRDTNSEFDYLADECKKILG